MHFYGLDTCTEKGDIGRFELQCLPFDLCLPFESKNPREIHREL